MGQSAAAKPLGTWRTFCCGVFRGICKVKCESAFCPFPPILASRAALLALYCLMALQTLPTPTCHTSLHLCDRNINSRGVRLYTVCNFFFFYFLDLNMFSWPCIESYLILCSSCMSVPNLLSHPLPMTIQVVPRLPCPMQCCLYCTAS